MLIELEIKNFALIDHLHIRFDEGLNILSGETGVGKSIIVNGIKLTLGERADKEHMRNRTKKTYLQSVFLKNSWVDDLLSELGLNTDEEIVVLSREILKSGRSVSRINGSIVTNATVKTLAASLIDIHGQHHHQSLLNKKNHIDILDDYAGSNMATMRQNFLQEYKEFQSLQQERASLSIDDRDRERKIDLLQFHIAEIEKAKLKLNEEEDLVQQYSVLANSEKIYGIMSAGYESLYHTNDGHSATDLISTTLEAFQSIANYDPKIQEYSSRLEEVQVQIDDLSRELRRYTENFEFHPEELDNINQRLTLIADMKRKYGPTVSDVFNYHKSSKNELENLLNSEQRILEIDQKIQEKEIKLTSMATTIHNIRSETAKVLEKKVSTALQELNIPHGSFKVDIASNLERFTGDDQKFNSKGCDRVEFLIKTNAGAMPKPLAKIASGGEISRVMLALKSLLADVDKISCMIFDEVDTGISGETAHLVGDKLYGISLNRQVICITHLPQIAARGTLHYKIFKSTTKDQTTTYLKELNNSDRVDEIGRLLGGTSTEITLKHAEELLKLQR